MELENAGAEAPVTDAALPPPEAPATEPAAAPAVEDVEAKLDEEYRQIFRKNNPERETNGRFKAVNQFVDDVQKEIKDAVSKDQPPVAATETPVASIQAPQSWSAEMKAHFASIPPAAQEYLLKRDSETSAKITQQGDIIARFEPTSKVIEQYKGAFERHGITTEEGLNRVLAANDALDKDPHGAIAWLMNAYGVDPRSFVGQQDGSAPEGQLHQTIAELRSEINELKFGLNTERQNKATSELKSVEKQIDDFSKDKPDWKDLEAEVIAQVVALKHANPNNPPLDTLKQAYENARWANPSARDRILKEQKIAEDKKNAEEAKKRADQAKAAASVNVKPATASSKAHQSFDDTLKSAYREAQSR